MTSSENERILFTRMVDPVAARGNVEEWLTQIEEVMFNSIKAETESALADFGKKDRNDWILAGWPGMCNISIDMMQWTQGSEEAMKKSGVVGL